ncbi:hypothetical protein [Mesorhizobium australicum]|nr:hypothetical protein [Mesorhizobium australicum]
MAWWKFSALITLALIGAWDGIKLVGTLLGLVAMPDDALLVVRFLYWLVATPWWVPAGLTVFWMLFLASKLWSNKLTPDEIEKLYGQANTAAMMRLERHVAMVSSGVAAAIGLVQIDGLKRELAEKNPDLKTKEGQAEWFRVMGKICAVPLPDYRDSPSAKQFITSETTLDTHYHFQIEAKDPSFPIADPNLAEKWAKMKASADEKEKMLRLIAQDSMSPK